MTPPQGKGEPQHLDRYGSPTGCRAFVLYGAMLVGAVVLFFLIDLWGGGLVAPQLATPGREGAHSGRQARLPDPCPRGPDSSPDYRPTTERSVLPRRATTGNRRSSRRHHPWAIAAGTALAAAFTAMIPHDSAIARAFIRKLDDFVTVLLLPADFTYTGMRTQVGLVSGLEHWFVCALIITVAIAGKFGGTLVSSRLARGNRAGRPDEHAGIDGADRAECWPGAESHLADFVRHDGAHGTGDNAGDDPDRTTTRTSSLIHS